MRVLLFRNSTTSPPTPATPDGLILNTPAISGSTLIVVKAAFQVVRFPKVIVPLAVRLWTTASPPEIVDEKNPLLHLRSVLPRSCVAVVPGAKFGLVTLLISRRSKPGGVENLGVRTPCVVSLV